MTYVITGDGFLRHMVRTVVGCLVEVGRGKRSPEWFTELLETKNRALAGATAPAEGLFLVSVSYTSVRDRGASPPGALADER